MVADPVREALSDGRPVVALESTIFTHGLPRPRNLEVALAAEESLRAIGVVPATIGVLRGVPTVGLTADQIRELGADDDVIKVSLRDLPIAAAQRRSGGTTVAGTAFLAARAGIAVFATGGLGGVHRGASETFDESADLPVLAQTPILMVSAGVKSILDVGASLERLETLSITLVGYRTTRFPGFYLADSGFAIDYAVDSPAEAADLVRARDALGVPGAILVANPVPAEHELDPAEHDRVLGEALAAMEAAGIGGHDATPYLLDHVQRATGGRSLDVNVAVYENNVALAGEIACALAGSRGRRSRGRPARVGAPRARARCRTCRGCARRGSRRSSRSGAGNRRCRGGAPSAISCSSSRSGAVQRVDETGAGLRSQRAARRRRGRRQCRRSRWCALRRPAPARR